MIRDILFQLSSYPVPTPDWVFGAVRALAERHQARVSVALCQPHFPRISNYLADKLVGASQAIAHENRESLENARKLACAFAEQIPDRIRGEQILVECASYVSGARVAEQARVFDLVILPVHDNPDHEMIAEDLVFSAGRPVLLLPEDAVAGAWERILIGWDGGRAAARALADALPFCREAGDVRLVTVTGEKPIVHAAGVEAARGHLMQHGVSASTGEIPAEGADAGTALLRHAEEIGADLVVAGAFGHSRLREFILGGATRTLVKAPRVPVLLSH